MTTDLAVDNRRPPPHLLVVPFPAQGHLLPLLHLSSHLATRFSFSLTIAITPQNLPLLSPFISSTPQIRPLVLPLPPSSAAPSGAEHARDLPDNASIRALIRAIASLRPSLQIWAQSQSRPPSAILSDFFLGWCLDLAADLRIPHLAFFSSSALLAAILHPLLLHLPSPPSPPSTPISASPSLPSFPFYQLPSMIRRYISGDPDWELTRRALLANSQSSAAVLNTFEFLESPFLAHIRSTGYASARLFAVGPIPPAVRTPAHGDLVRWLDSCPPRSVVYICFGSQLTLDPSIAAVLAAALEIAGVRFVWGIGKGAVDLPEGFEERAGDRGWVVRGWAPQTAVLGHAAVAAFVTHGGWNSVLEGMTAGVLLLVWPMEADQFLNAWLLVEEARVAKMVCDGGPSAVPEVTEIGKLMLDAVAEGTWPEVRVRAAEMRRNLEMALKEGGSSFLDMEELGKFLTSGR